MANYTNINIKDIDSTYKYILEYEPSDSIIKTEKICWRYSAAAQTIGIYDENINTIRTENVWDKFDYNKDVNKDNFGKIYNQIYLPGINQFYIDLSEVIYDFAKIKLYFPNFSVDTYEDGIQYALSIYTWIHGRKISLGNYIINRLDAIACERKRFLGDDYYEYVEFNIVDPWELTYSDDWLNFRKNVCKEPQNINSTGSILYFTLYPVHYVEDKYIMVDKYQGGQNSINISFNRSDYFNLHLYHNIKEYNQEPKILCELKFNDSYKNNIYEYLKETYNINSDNIKAECELVVKDDEDCYKYIKKAIDLPHEQNEESPITIEFSDKDIMFENWLGYKEGLNIISSLNIIDGNGDQIMYLKSNEIPLTQELFSYFVGKREIEFINLNGIKDMNLYNINVVNKTINQITQIERPNDSKSNIIQPIFFKARDVSNLIIHPVVTEYITINLDPFKSKVNTFMVQIEGCVFPEIGRTSSGIIFKIVGSKLPNKIQEGVYYVLNQDGELITNGKYKYDV